MRSQRQHDKAVVKCEYAMAAFSTGTTARTPRLHSTPTVLCTSLGSESHMYRLWLFHHTALRSACTDLPSCPACSTLPTPHASSKHAGKALCIIRTTLLPPPHTAF